MDAPLSNRTTRLSDALIFGLLLIAPVGLCIRPLLSGAIPDFMDPMMYFFPLRWHAASLVLDGQMPWWNRCILTGAPLFSNPQAALAYPFNWPMLVRPGGLAYSAPLLFQMGLFAGSTFLMLRRAGLGLLAAFLPAALILTGSYGWTNLQLGNFMNVLPWWPLWGLAGIAFAASPRSVSLTGGGLAVAMMILAGAHQLAIYGALGLGLLVLPALAGPARLRWIAFSLGSAATGLLIGAPGWLPQLHFLRETSRADGLATASVLAGTLAVPFDLVHELTGSAAQGSSLAIGAFALVVAGVIPIDPGRRRLWLGAWIAALVTSLLAWRPVASVALEVLPGYSAFHDPKRILGVTQWLLLVAAGLGADALVSSGLPLSRRWWTALPAVGLIGIVAWARVPGTEMLNDLPLALGALFVSLMLGLRLGDAPGLTRTALRAGIPLVLMFAATALLALNTSRTIDTSWRLAGDLVGNGPPELLSSATLGPGERFFTVDWKRDSSYDFRRPDLRDSALPNLAMLWGLEDVGGYEPARTPRYDRWLASAAPWPAGRQPWRDWFGLPFPPPPDTPQFASFAEGNPRAGLLPRWGLPAYLFPIDSSRSGALLPPWNFTMNLHVLYRPGVDSAATRSAVIVDEAGRGRSLPFREDRRIAATVPLLGFPTQPPGQSPVETDPGLQVQVLGVEPARDGSRPAGLELSLPAAEFPAWVFMWSPRLASAYHPESDTGLQTRVSVQAPGEWAVVRGEGGQGTILQESIRANRIELRVNWNGNGPGRVRIHDAWWPGWRAWVADRQVAVTPSGPDGGGLWREIAIPPGESDILLIYEPPLLRVSLWSSLVGLLLLMCAGWSLDRGRATGRTEAPGASAIPNS